jgi:hypothetical protein
MIRLKFFHRHFMIWWIVNNITNRNLRRQLYEEGVNNNNVITVSNKKEQIG